MGFEKEKRIYREILGDHFGSSENFGIERDIVRRHFLGDIIVVGGANVRAISREVHKDLYELKGFELPRGDNDYMVYTNSGIPLEEPGFSVYQTPFGDARYVNLDDPTWTFDVIQLTNFHPFFRGKGVQPKISNFYNRVSVNTQAISYNVDTGELKGMSAIKGIKWREVWVVKYSEAIIQAKREGFRNLEAFVQSEANKFLFEYIKPGRKAMKKSKRTHA